MNFNTYVLRHSLNKTYGQNMIIDHAHYVAQFFWVVGNSIWAIGEIWYSNRDYPFPLGEFSTESVHTCRFYSSWTLLFAYAPILVLYCIWLPLTCLGRLEHIEAERHFFELVSRGSNPDGVASYISDAFSDNLSDEDEV